MARRNASRSTVFVLVGQQSLSVLDLSKDKHFHVKHYRIRRTEQGEYYISTKHVFPTLTDLVEHYRGNRRPPIPLHRYRLFFQLIRMVSAVC
jgi:hypothetical protein